MELYIQIRDGQPFEHPIMGDNFREAFSDIDVTNLPPEFAKFVRVLRPSFTVLPEGPYGVTELKYVLDTDGVSWKDEWSVRDMTAEEKAEKIALFQTYKPYPSWIFNEPLCYWGPPIPVPTDGYWQWDEPTLAWVDATPPEMQLSTVSFL